MPAATLREVAEAMADRENSLKDDRPEVTTDETEDLLKKHGF